MKHSLTHKTIDAHGDLVTSPLDREMSFYARDALAKAVYARLFDWLVRRINTSLYTPSCESINHHVLGILDIYGFEVFQTNAFEQVNIKLIFLSSLFFKIFKRISQKNLMYLM